MLLLQTVELESLLLGLHLRLPQLEEDVSRLEEEDDGELFGVLSLYVVENEMTEIQQMIDKLNSTALGRELLSADTVQQVDSPLHSLGAARLPGGAG